MKHLIFAVLFTPILSFAQVNEKRFKFDEIPFQTIIDTLAKHYKLDVQYIGNVTNANYTASYKMYDKIDSIIVHLNFLVTDLHIKVRNEVIEVKRK